MLFVTIQHSLMCQIMLTRVSLLIINMLYFLLIYLDIIFYQIIDVYYRFLTNFVEIISLKLINFLPLKLPINHTQRGLIIYKMQKLRSLLKYKLTFNNLYFETSIVSLLP